MEWFRQFDSYISKDLAPHRGGQPTLSTPRRFCHSCDRIELKYDTRNLENWSDWEIGSLTTISQRKATCYLCHLIYYLVREHFAKYGITLDPASTINLQRPKWQIAKSTHFSPYLSVVAPYISVVVQRGGSPSIMLGDTFSISCPNRLSHRTRPSIGPFHSDSSITLLKKIRSLREKLQHCDKHHTVSYDAAVGRTNSLPVFFIDTMKLCIVASTTKSSYFSLSYVWGDGPKALLTHKNVDILMQPGGLRQIWHSIPRVVREAIQLVSELDVYETRYLWVDSLCILDDDKEHKHTQISQMDVIYGQAAMTIVALAATNASSALFCPDDASSGFGQVLREVEEQKNVEFVPDFRLSNRVIQEADKLGYVYRTRGWTFQEEHLSRRLLYCTKSGFVFRCGVHEWSPRGWIEDSEETSSPNVHQSLKKIDYMHRWSSMVEAYTSRNLTYQSDVLRAFSGLAKSFQHPHPAKSLVSLSIICGVCVDLFPFSLLWIPLEPKECSQRLGFPTWSWASSNSQIRFTPSFRKHDSGSSSHVAGLASVILVPTDFEDEKTSEKSLLTASTSASADSKRFKIRKRAISILRSSNDPSQNPQGTLPGAENRFYMLQIQIQYKTLRWHHLRLKVEPVKKRTDLGYNRNFLTHYNFDSIFMSLGYQNLWSDIYPLDNKFMNLRIVNGGKEIGGLNVRREQFDAFKDDTLVLIPLFKSDGLVDFLLAICVGDNLYERIGIGWSGLSIGWTLTGGEGLVVNLI